MSPVDGVIKADELFVSMSANANPLGPSTNALSVRLPLGMISPPSSVNSVPSRLSAMLTNEKLPLLGAMIKC